VSDEAQLPIQPDPGPQPDPDPAPPAIDATPRPTGPRPPAPGARPLHPARRRGGEPDPEDGPGVGCFWVQVAVLVGVVVLVPIGLAVDWPFELVALLVVAVIGLVLLVGQSVVFVLRLLVADRRSRGRRRQLAAPTATASVAAVEPAEGPAPAAATAAEPADRPAPDDRPSADAPPPPDDEAGRADAPGPEDGGPGVRQ
jgi:hypothetical protein